MLKLLPLLMLSSTLALAEPRTLDWLDLLPDDDLQALLDMPEIEHDWAEEAPGTFEQSLRQIDANLPAVMYSTRVIAELDGQQVRIAGFPVPLQQDANGRYTSFFLVPYAGACIHVPPPPPNQIVLVDYPQGLAIDSLYDAFWVSGQLHTEQSSNELADASYRLTAQRVWLYDGD